MTTRHLKTIPAAAACTADCAIIDADLKEIKAKDEAAVHDISVKVDTCDRDSYRLTKAQIEALIAKVFPREIADIKFAQN